MMSDININELFKELSPELQEKAKSCTSNKEFLELAADNDIELPEEVLEAVSGGGSCSDSENKDIEHDLPCPDCGRNMYFYDTVWFEKTSLFICRYHCKSCNNGLFWKDSIGDIHKY